MTELFDIRDADQSISDLISQVEVGKDFFVTRNEKPVALIIKFEDAEEQFPKLNFGAGKGIIPEWPDEEWEKADEEIRAAYDPERKWSGE